MHEGGCANLRGKYEVQVSHSTMRIQAIKITWLNLQVNTLATQLFHIFTCFNFHWLDLFGFCAVKYSS